MVTCRSLEPSVWFPILMWAPDICRISLILLPCRPMMQPMSWRGRDWGELGAAGGAVPSMELPGLSQPPAAPGRRGETEADTGRAGCCFLWADPAFWSHSSPRPGLALLGCHILRLFLGVGRALSPCCASVSLFLPAASAPAAPPAPELWGLRQSLQLCGVGGAGPCEAAAGWDTWVRAS